MAQSHQHPEPEPALDPNWIEGDWTLISSDNVRLKVPSYLVLANSVVLRDAHDINNNDSTELAFDDLECEKAETLRLFLSLASDGTLGPEMEVMSWPRRLAHIMRLLSFANKWQCPTIRRAAVSSARELGLKNRDMQLPAFIIGAIAGDDLSCKEVLGRLPPCSYRGSARPSNAIAHPWKDTLCMDPRAMAWEMWKCVPPEYLWALCQGWKVTKRGVCDADEFSFSLKKARRSFRKTRSNSLPADAPVVVDIDFGDEDGDLQLLSSDRVLFICAAQTVKCLT